MSQFTVKMAQYGIEQPPDDWAVTEPVKQEDPALDVAKEFMGKMTRIGPELYLDSKVASLMTAIKALGLPMNSKQDLMNIAGWFVDDSVLMEHIGWFNDAEFAMLLSWLSKLPTKVSMVVTMCMKRLAQQLDAPLELLMSLNELQFELAADSPKTKALLDTLAKSPCQSAPIAQQIINMDPQSRSNLFNRFDSKAFGEQEQVKLNPSAPIYSPEPQWTLDTDIQEPESTSTPAPRSAPTNPQQPSPVPERRLHRAPALEPEAPSSVLGEPEVKPIPTSRPIRPTSSRDKAWGVADFTNRYEEYNVGLPQDVTPVGYGDSAGLKIWPREGGTGPDTVAKGGMFVKDITPDAVGRTIVGAEAMVVGAASDGKLAVRVFPKGEFERWDLNNRLIRLSNTTPPKRDF